MPVSFMPRLSMGDLSRVVAVACVGGGGGGGWGGGGASTSEK